MDAGAIKVLPREHRMSARIVDWLTLVMYALAAISGGLGGGAVASHGVLRGQPPRSSYVIAYVIIGMMFGVLMLAYGSLFGADTASLDKLIGHAVLAGAVGSMLLASSNLSARWVLKRLGIEIEVTIKRSGDEKTREGE